MLLKKWMIAYLCSFFAVNTSYAARTSDNSGSSAFSDELSQESGAGGMTTSPLLLGNATEYASDISGDMTPGASMTQMSPLTGAPQKETGIAPPTHGTEYVSGYYKGAVLMPIRLWGAVRQPGLHKVPTGTDVMQLLTLAGGPNADAQLDDVTIRRTTKEGVQTIRVDVGHLIDSTDAKVVELRSNDVVLLPAKRPLIGNDTLALITAVGAVIAAISSGFAISAYFKAEK